ncbi:hypothetical protein PVAP13_2NG123003 [Panicum virgatum]|uniref:Uncharacterized protein n=1 Tax=Panicum virgatum TaxID=38727 RepID=A0A8T0V7N3_PANVG|nr:hypothetical protein PVAP13_2NG123003 [Panicum virgatum]
MASNSMASSPALVLLLLAMALTLATSAPVQALAPAPSPSSQAFCPPSFDSLEAFEENAKQNGAFFTSFLIFESPTGIASRVTGIQEGQNPTLNLCVCTYDPDLFSLLARPAFLSRPKVMCYLGSLPV